MDDYDRDEGAGAGTEALPETVCARRCACGYRLRVRGDWGPTLDRFLARAEHHAEECHVGRERVTW